jgi:thiosulfate dehydrogenase [quinone] large subunit
MSRSPADRPGDTTVAAWALLPLRLFLGVTFVFAGLDKLLSADFFDALAPASIQAQFAIFERSSPLAPLVHAAEPYAVLVGLLIALGEIGAGLGALTGLCFRLAALGGSLLALLFLLTASWTVRPYYLGPDLPYAIGWLTLALAGHGGLFVVEHRREPRVAPRERPALSRRLLLQVGVLAAATLAVGGLGAGLRAVLGGPGGGTPGGPTPRPDGKPPPSATPSDRPLDPSAPPGETPGPASTPTPIVIARVADVERSGSAYFHVPVTAPAPLPAGDTGIVVRLSAGTYAAFDAACTHEGCRVAWDPTDDLIVCPCHGAEFDPAARGAVVAGPATVPLRELPLVIDAQAGTVALRI